MSEANRCFIRAEEIAKLAEFPFRHPLNPNSEVHLRSLSAVVGLQRIGFHMGRIPPEKESFVYHFHHHEEEFVYILSGRGIAEIDNEEFEIGPGDFLGFTAPSVAHHLRNPFDVDLVYLMGGERCPVEVGEFPRLKKRVIRDGNEAYFVDLNSIEVFSLRSE
jgi:uncharacterized cupin superfamily protein